MRRRIAIGVIFGASIALLGFVAAALASGSNPLGALQASSSSTTSTTLTTSTTTSTATTSTTGKVTICHHTHSATNPFVTITISVNAWPAHQAHGDTMGACPTSTTSTLTTAVSSTTTTTGHKHSKHKTRTKPAKRRHHR